MPLLCEQGKAGRGMVGGGSHFLCDGSNTVVRPSGVREM